MLVLVLHEGAARLLDDMDVASRLLSPSAATGIVAGAATVFFLVCRVLLVFGAPAVTVLALVSALGQHRRVRALRRSGAP